MRENEKWFKELKLGDKVMVKPNLTEEDCGIAERYLQYRKGRIFYIEYIYEDEERDFGDYKYEIGINDYLCPDGINFHYSERFLEQPIEKENDKMSCNCKKDMDLYFAKVKEDAIIPSKDEENGGYDIYACFEEDYLVIPPHTTKMIPSGIATAFSKDFVMILKERGSTGTKGLGQRSGVVDSGYRGEIFVPLTNENNVPVYISKLSKEDTPMTVDLTYGESIYYPYTKGICQAIMVEVPKMAIKEISYEDLLKIESKRGTGALGSSGK